MVVCHGPFQDPCRADVGRIVIEVSVVLLINDMVFSRTHLAPGQLQETCRTDLDCIAIKQSKVLTSFIALLFLSILFLPGS
jgi:hypothetical protein